MDIKEIVFLGSQACLNYRLFRSVSFFPVLGFGCGYNQGFDILLWSSDYSTMGF